ncbi:hypothetical protein EV182_000013 [Spiromyces aspiralis]|uniref:Uncharacterized protein n=1 Tax=Spiromyces aspiralis TaxID=68401 RepID=A0ACC1HVV5_9FUNG|nr:hypothetical protein EV182_000013 [Spiromyces aspiralis]
MALLETKEFVNCYRIEGAPDKLNEALLRMAASFAVSDAKMREIIDRFHQSMRDGLNGDEAGMPMIPSFIDRRPTGNEQGKFLSLDLGGTNLRVCQVTLLGKSDFHMVQQKFTIPAEAKERTLFDWIAQCVSIFVEEHDVEPNPGEYSINCGFTFSFPINQTGLAEGNLIMWNKGFLVPNSVGRDVVRLTQDAFLRKHLRVRIVAILNDTVGALMTSCYSNPDSQLGIIFGTGTNACYWERLSNIGKWAGPKEGEMVINTEWGAFDNAIEVLPYTMHDNKLNRKSPNHGLQVFEKMISGMYLGEVARNALLYLVDQRLLFDGRSSPIFNKSYAFDTAYMSEIVSDDSPDLTEVRKVFEQTLEIPSPTLLDCKVAKAVCDMIGTRAMRLSAASMAAVLLWRPEMLKGTVTVGIDGSMYQFYPSFDKALYDNCRPFLGDDFVDNKLKLRLAKDGSGVGAAIIAAVASKHLQ